MGKKSKKESRKAAKAQREEEQAKKVIKGLFIGLIALAVICIVAYAFA